MNKDIYYVTGNELKIKLANQMFKDTNINIIQDKTEIPEIQSLDCVEVSKTSSKYAANLLKKTVIKNDSGLFIEALNGFPGALSKYAEDTITAEGYIKLLNGVNNRKCYWIEVLSYCEPDGEPVSFSSYTYGTIAESIHNGRGYDYDKIFIPLNDTRTFSCMSEEEQINCFDVSAYKQLLEYLSK